MKRYTGGLLAALVLLAARDARALEPPPPGSCAHSPEARCVIRLSLAAVEEIAGAAPRAYALARIAEAQASAGEAGEAWESLSRALAAAAVIDAAAYEGDLELKTSAEDAAFGEQARVFSLIARIQTDVGDTAGARETFSRAVAAAQEYGSAALVEVARMQVAAGALPEARRTLARADLPGNIFGDLFGLPELVRAQAKAGDVAGALATARTIPGDTFSWERAQALATVAAARAEAGDVSGALTVVEEIGSEYYRMVAMGDIGRARAREGDVAGAWEAVRKIWDEILGDHRLKADADAKSKVIIVAGTVTGIVEAHLARGEFEEASAAVRSAVRAGYMDDLAFVDVGAAIVKARLAAGQLDAARGAARELCDGAGHRYRVYCVEALADLATALADAGRNDAGRDLASTGLDEAGRIEFDSDQHRAFVTAYTALMRAGDVEAARRAFSSALAIADAEEEFVRMAAASAREGDSGSAGRLVAAGGGMSARALVLGGLAWVRAGDADVARTMFSPAVAAVMASGTAAGRAGELAGIAFALASGRWPGEDGYQRESER